jgi:hypothetical protein
MAVVRFEYRVKYPLQLTSGISSLRNFAYIAFASWIFIFMIEHFFHNNLGREYYKIR